MGVGPRSAFLPDKSCVIATHHLANFTLDHVTTQFAHIIFMVFIYFGGGKELKAALVGPWSWEEDLRRQLLGQDLLTNAREMTGL